jgi:peptidoglycan/LPS O-acetylase OafA/YrhL
MIDCFTNSGCKIIERANLISKYRDSIMGFAILWVAFFHSGIDFGKTGFLSYFLSFIKYTGYLGVDIFFFVSGFGLMVGRCKKKYSIYSFYKRRFLRIMPMFWFFLSLSIVLFGMTRNLSSTLIEYTGISFLLLHDFNQWFINAIIFCYLIFPFYAHFIEKSEKKLRSLSIVVLLCLLLALILSASAFIFTDKFSFLLILILRLPAFFIGGLVGYIYIKKDASFSRLFAIYLHSVLLFFCYMVLALIYLFSSSSARVLYGLNLYPFVLGSFSFTLLLSIFFEAISRHSKCLLNISDKIGKSSLELYFIHLLLFSQIVKIQSIFNFINIPIHGNYLWLIAILSSVILAIAFNSIWSLLIFAMYNMISNFKSLICRGGYT